MVDWIEYLCDVMEAWNQLRRVGRRKLGAVSNRGWVYVVASWNYVYNIYVGQDKRIASMYFTFELQAVVHMGLFR